MIQISTHRKYGRIKILVKDNGVGIAEKIVDKTISPFFTTKPTGEGTGIELVSQL